MNARIFSVIMQHVRREKKNNFTRTWRHQVRATSFLTPHHNQVHFTVF